MKAIIKSILFNIWSLLRNKKKQEYLFIMGQPRSGSSLLMHILTTNKDVLGFGEYFTIYRDSNELLKAEFDIRRKATRPFKNYFYIANQILHFSRTPNLELLKNKHIKHIIILRKPEETLSSMFLLSEKKQNPISQTKITNIYIERLHFFSTLSQELDRLQWTFLTYESLLKNTDQELQKLSDFLKLKKKLSPNYQLKKYTQIWGDPSENIKEGIIFKTNSKQIQWNKELLINAQEEYSKTLFKLKSL